MNAAPPRTAVPMYLTPDSAIPTRFPAQPGRGRAPARLAAAALAAALSGCQLWPFGSPERTTIVTPAMRVSTIQESVARARNSGVGQRELCQQLAVQIRTEPDPIVRQTIQEAMGEFNTSLAQAVLEAGLNDDNIEVQATCCRILGERGNPSAVPALASLINTAAEDEIRLAAVDALGQIDSPESAAAIAIALKDNNPAMQFAGVQAMQSISDEDFGNNVQAWREYAQKLAPDGRETAVAERPDAVSSR